MKTTTKTTHKTTPKKTTKKHLLSLQFLFKNLISTNLVAGHLAGINLGSFIPDPLSLLFSRSLSKLQIGLN